MYYIYILYSPGSDRYYIGYTDNPRRRLEEHNSDPKVSYTSKHRPWILKGSYPVGIDRGFAVKVERHIKKLKSRKIIEKLIELDDLNFIIEKIGKK